MIAHQNQIFNIVGQSIVKERAHGVGAFTGQFDDFIRLKLNHVDIIALAAIKFIVTLIAIEVIIAVLAIKRIVAVATVNGVTVGAAIHNIIAVAGINHIGAFQAVNDVGAVGAVNGVFYFGAVNRAHFIRLRIFNHIARVFIDAAKAVVGIVIRAIHAGLGIRFRIGFGIRFRFHGRAQINGQKAFEQSTEIKTEFFRRTTHHHRLFRRAP